MNGFFLLIPFLFIRFILLNLISKEALVRAAFFAPLAAGEKIAYGFFQICSALFIVYPFFLKVEVHSNWFLSGLILYLLANLTFLVSVVSFAKPNKNGINTTGIYKFSRNPMYVAYFIYFASCVLLAKSLVLFISLIVFQISAHWIILSEERWCIQTFAVEYKSYMKNTRRYI